MKIVLESFLYQIDGGGDVDDCIKLARKRIADAGVVLSAAALRMLDEIDDFAQKLRHARETEPIERESDGMQIGETLIDEGDGITGTLIINVSNFGPLPTEPREPEKARRFFKSATPADRAKG